MLVHSVQRSQYVTPDHLPRFPKSGGESPQIQTASDLLPLPVHKSSFRSDGKIDPLFLLVNTRSILVEESGTTIC